VIRRTVVWVYSIGRKRLTPQLSRTDERPRSQGPRRISENNVTAQRSQACETTARKPDAAGSSLAHKTLWSATASVTATASAALSSIIVARLLGPRGTGEVAYSMWLAASTASVFAFGYPQAIARFSAELVGAGRSCEAPQVARSLVRRALVTLALGVLVVVFVEGVVRRGPPPSIGITLVVAAWYCGQGLAALNAAVLAGRQEFRTASILNAACAAVQLIVVAAGSALGGVTGALLGYFAGTLIPATACLRFAVGPVAQPSPSMRVRIRSYSLHAWIAATMSLVLWSRTEVFFLERWWGPHEIAMFTVGLSLAQIATQGPLLLGSALIPHFAQLAGAGDVQRIRSTYSALTRVLAFLLFPVCLLVAAASPVAVPLLFGRPFRDAAGNAAILVAFASLGAIGSAGTSVMYAMGHSRFIAVSGTLGAMVGLVAFAYAIRDWGAVGATWARSVLQIGLLAWGHWYLYKAVRLSVPLRDVAVMALCAFGGAIPVMVVARSGSAIPWVFPAVGAGIALYLLGIRYAGCLRPADLAGLRQTAERVVPRAKRWVDSACAWVTRAQAP
jgi:O-antigen/teichoic acid export membrane protein